MFLQDIQGFRKGNLKKTSGTTITRKDGSKYVENITESGIESTELDMSFVVFIELSNGNTDQRDEEILRFPIEVKKTNLLKDLKAKILTEILEQQSFSQLYLYNPNGTLLTEDEQTLESLGITFMSTLLMDLSKSDIWKSSTKIQTELSATVSKMPLFIELDVYKFNHKTNKWEVYQNTENSQLNHLSIVTYNIWFSSHHFEKRCKALLETIKNCDSDFICLQEVLPQFLEKLLLEPWVRDNYFLSDSDKYATVEPYGDILLSKHPISKLRLYDLPTQMSRRFVVADLLINNEKVKVGTVHLESLGFSELRSQQLKTISKVLGPTTCKYAFLVGDTNICGTSKENASIPSSFVDMWPTLHKQDPGWTCGIAYPDSEDTRLIRIDRILFRNHETNANPKWMPKTINLIGNTPFDIAKTEENKEEVLYPSDHFGLFGKYEYTKQS